MLLLTTGFRSAPFRKPKTETDKLKKICQACTKKHISSHHLQLQKSKSRLFQQKKKKKIYYIPEAEWQSLLRSSPWEILLTATNDPRCSSISTSKPPPQQSNPTFLASKPLQTPYAIRKTKKTTKAEVPPKDHFQSQAHLIFRTT